MKKIQHLLSSITDEISFKITEQTIRIPITTKMLLALVKKQNVSELKDIDISIGGNKILIRGTVKKMLINMKFSIELTPLMSEGRLLSFRVEDMKPLNNEWIKSKLFNRRGVSYNHSIVTFDLNVIEKVKGIKIGNIKNVEIVENKILVSIGL